MNTGGVTSWAPPIRDSQIKFWNHLSYIVDISTWGIWTAEADTSSPPTGGCLWLEIDDALDIWSGCVCPLSGECLKCAPQVAGCKQWGRELRWLVPMMGLYRGHTVEISQIEPGSVTHRVKGKRLLCCCFISGVLIGWELIILCEHHYIR